jgi:calcineurin-like phosphoesterase family protein
VNIRPSIFLTADTHFGHSKIYAQWENREEGFEKRIIADWNSTVTKHDTVLHLGDLAICSKEKALAWCKQLKGKKYLIRGNHDGQSDGWLADCGFTVIPEAFYRHQDKYGNWTNYLLTHIPVRPIPDDWYNIHGHLHGNDHRGRLPTSHHLDVGIDVFPKLIRLSEVIDIFTKKEVTK